MSPQPELEPMNLKDCSLVSPLIQVGEVVKALEVAIPPEAIEQKLSDLATQILSVFQEALLPPPCVT